MAAAKPSGQGSLFSQEFGYSPGQLAGDDTATVFTIGHSNRKVEELIEALRTFGIERLVDIRNFPSSKYNPQFNQRNLAETLKSSGIEYQWVQKLGGYREEGYVPYMATADFAAGLERFEELAREKRTTCMCSELKWMNCHRRHVSDVLSDRGWRVVHIVDASHAELHRA